VWPSSGPMFRPSGARLLGPFGSCGQIRARSDLHRGSQALGSRRSLVARPWLITARRRFGAPRLGTRPKLPEWIAD
jgi:hypothetical protein